MIYQGEIKRVIGIASQVTGFNENALTGESRKKHTAHARFIAIKAVKEATGRPLSTIGKAFHRDHSTVAHALNRAAEIIADSEDAAAWFHDIMVMAATSRTRPDHIVSHDIDRNAPV